MRSIVSRYILNIQYTSNQRYDICWKTSWFNWCNWWFHKTATDVGWIYLWMIYDARSMTMMYDVRWKEWTHFMNTAVRSLINCQHSGSWSLDIMKELISRWWFQGDFFPTCQVRVVRFYVSLFSFSFSSFLLLPPPPVVLLLVGSQLRSCECRTPTASSWVQCGVPDPNRDPASSVWRPGPQPRSCEFSVAARTPTAILWVQCGGPDPNRDPVSSVWRAGPQVLCQKICQKEWQKICQKECEKTCQKECQKICQKECQEICQKEWRKICQKECQKECQKICQKECQEICQKECQKICPKECREISQKI